MAWLIENASAGCSRSSFQFFCKGNPFFGLFSQSVGIVIDRAPPDFKKSLSSASGSGSLTSIVTVI